MAYSSGSEPEYDEYYDDRDMHYSVDVSSWTNGQDPESHQKRSDIFHDIIENNCVDQLRTIVEGGWDVNEELTGHVPQAPLLYAIIHSKKCDDRLKIVQLLLKHGANPSVEYKINIAGYGEPKWAKRTALCEVVRQGLTELAKMLLDAGVTCKMSGTLPNPLALPMQSNDCPTDLNKLLLNKGADPNDHDGQAENIPLFCAISGHMHHLNRIEIVRLLLEHGADPSVSYRVKIEGHESEWENRTVLHVAAKWGMTEVVKMLLDAGAKSDTSALHGALRRGCTESVKMLLDAGATSDASQNPLALALQSFDRPLELIELLLQHGADPNDHDDQLENIPLLVVIKDSRYPPNDDSKIVQLLLEHGANPNVTHKVNVAKHGEAKWVQRSALHEAALRGWTEGVKILLDGGAKCTSDGLQNPLALAVERYECPLDVIELLLKHGADPNDHDDQTENIPLLGAISNNMHDPSRIEVIRLLLEHGADPSVSYRVKIEGHKGEWVNRTALNEAARWGFTDAAKMLLDAGAKCLTSEENPLALALNYHKSPPDLIELLLKHGADLHFTDTTDKWNKQSSLTHRLTQYPFNDMFLQPQLDLVFLHGGNINMEGCEQKTPLEDAVRNDGHSSSVRWLIRHGADVSLQVYLLKGHFMYYRSRSPETPIILLQAGMRVSHGAQELLSSQEVATTMWLQDDTEDDRNIKETVYGMWEQFEMAEQEELQRVQCNQKKCTLPKYCTRQMVDLQEFSDDSLQVYNRICLGEDTRQGYQNMLDQIHRVQEFLSQPQSLQWYCRRCVRENLTSLQPSVVRTLPIPARLKRYILCHEI